MRSRTARLIVCLIRDPDKRFSFDAHLEIRAEHGLAGQRDSYNPDHGIVADLLGILQVHSARFAPEAYDSRMAPFHAATFRPGGNASGTLFYPLGLIWIGQYNSPTSFSATGLDRGIITDIFYGAGVGVYFK